MKNQNIVKESWDYLIILDACRYDFFEKVFEDFLEGDLEKRKSEGSSTGEWLVKTFPDKYDYTYLSSNPNINSLGVPCFWDAKWKAVDHFERIIDAWDLGWNEKLKSVPPDKMNEVFIEEKINNRCIIHYDQPHASYLSYNHNFIPAGTRMKNDDGKTESNLFRQKIIDFGFWFEGKVSKVNSWRIRKLLGIAPRNPVEEVWRNCEKQKIHELYEDNLRRVLGSVSTLVKDELEGKIIVTADHGEAFGEKGVWEHPSNTPIPTLVEVPWLVIEK